MEPVEFKMTRPRKPVSIRFDPVILAKVRALARQKGVPYQTLLQMWVAEKVQESSEAYR
jgi:predicted DNA binding CopG/RHH family protein